MVLAKIVLWCFQRAAYGAYKDRLDAYKDWPVVLTKTGLYGAPKDRPTDLTLQRPACEAYKDRHIALTSIVQWTGLCIK
jgi:hypothetical protein